jgi:hypothetical protein
VLIFCTWSFPCLDPMYIQMMCKFFDLDLLCRVWSDPNLMSISSNKW